MKKQLFVISSSMLLVLQGAIALAEESDQDLLKKVNATPPVLARQQKDHQIAACVENLDTGKSVNVYRTMFELPLAYSFSLGWFVGTDRAGACIDEFGKEVPLPGEKPAKEDIDEGDFHAVKGFDEVLDGNLNKAGKEFEQAATVAPTSARIHNNLGVYYALTDKPDKAQEEFDAAVKLAPKSAILLCNQAWYKRFSHHTDDAADELKQVLALQPELPSALLLAGKIDLDMNKYDEAQQVAKLGMDKTGYAVFGMLSGDAYVGKGDLKDAKQSYQKVLLTDSSNIEVLLKQAQVLQQLSDTDGAVKVAKAAVDAAPNNAQAHLALGHLLESGSDLKAAQLQYERALELDPPLSVQKAIWGPLLRVLMASNQADLADKYAKKWIKENPEDADCHFNRAWSLSQIQDSEHFAEAIKEYREALKLNNKLVQTHYNLALLLANTGHSDQATTELQTFIEKSPDDPDVPNARKLLEKLSH